MTHPEYRRFAALCIIFALSALASLAQKITPAQLATAEQKMRYGGSVMPTLLQAADEGSAAAKRDLGLVFLSGLSNRPADPVLALQWFENASLRGDVRASSYIGDFYLNPKNGPVDAVNARFWYKKADNEGDARGTVALAALSCNGTGTAVDLRQCGTLLAAAASLTTASDPPDVTASLKQYDILLGSAYHAGHGVPRNNTLAASWYDKAATLGSVSAALAESHLYLEPGGLHQDLPKAIQILDSVTKLALDGAIVSMCSPAHFLGHELVTQAYVEIGAKYEAHGPQSFPQALAIYSKALALGDGAPSIALGLRYANGTGVPMDLDKAQAILMPLTTSGSIKEEDRISLSAAFEVLAERVAARHNPVDSERIALLKQTARPPVLRCWASPKAEAMTALPPAVVERYPNLQAPDTIPTLQTFTVQVSLNAIQFDNNTQILNGDQNNGQLRFTLPAGMTSMPIDVALIAPGMTFVVGTTNTATLTLDASNPNSIPATFQVQAPATPKATELIATLSYHQTFLAQLARAITITAATTDSTPASQTSVATLVPPSNSNAITRSDDTPIGAHILAKIAPSATTTPKPSAPEPPIVMQLAPRPRTPAQQPILANPTGQLSDLTIIETLVGDSMSYQIIGPGIDPAAPSLVPDATATAAKVQSDYSQLQSQALLLAAGSGVACASDRASHSAKASDNGSDTDANCADAVFSRGLIEGIGTDLYTHDAPDSFRAIYQQMLAAHTRLHSITIVTNNPLLPWELMCVPSPTGKGCNLLGLTTAIVRENSAAPQLAQPADIPFSAIDVVAPNYTGTLSLAGAAAELKAIVATFPLTKQIAGDASSVSLMVKAAPQGIIHFTGHGKRVNASGPSTPARATTAVLSSSTTSAPSLAPRVAIALEDYDMTPDTFIAFRAEGSASAHPFYFFNACDLGQSDKELTYVAGWAPELMRSGAAGYLGALYEVGDTSASNFAAHFYADLKTNLASNTPWTMADLVTQARQQTYAESNDPTALAYVLYAKPFMKLVSTN